MTNHPTGMARLLANTGFELIPMKVTLERAASLPTDTRVTVTASPAKGMDATVELTEQLVDLGLHVVPHISARLTKSIHELEGILRRLDRLSIKEAFIVGGDADDPGAFLDAMDLIRALNLIGHPFERLGVAGYPEGHPNIAEHLLLEALVEKQPHAGYVATQMCFDLEAIERWIRSIRSMGITLPVVIGIPGVTDIARLITISTRIGVGTSMRFLSKNRSLASKLIRPFSPDDLVEDLAGLAEDPELDVIGLHVYTFNQVEQTYRWYSDTVIEVAS